MNPKEKDNEIIELSDEELEEIFADDDFDNGEEDGEIRSFYFSNPDPYAKAKPRPDDAHKREFSFFYIIRKIFNINYSFAIIGAIYLKNSDSLFYDYIKQCPNCGSKHILERIPYSCVTEEDFICIEN